jgi:hypothetical protein
MALVLLSFKVGIYIFKYISRHVRWSAVGRYDRTDVYIFLPRWDLLYFCIFILTYLVPLSFYDHFPLAIRYLQITMKAKLSKAKENQESWLG